MRDRFVTNVTIQCVHDALNSPRRRSYPQKVSLCSLCMHRVPPNRPVRNNLPSRRSLSLVLPLLVSLSSSLSPELRYIRTNSDWPWTYRRGRSSSHSNATIFLSLSLSLFYAFVRCTRHASKREKECDRFSYSFESDPENRFTCRVQTVFYLTLELGRCFCGMYVYGIRSWSLKILRNGSRIKTCFRLLFYSVFFFFGKLKFLKLVIFLLYSKK